MNGDRKPQVQIATLWERESASGRRYSSGYLNGNSLLLFDAGMQDHPTKPGEQVHVWNLILQERDPAPRANNRPVTRSEQSTQLSMPARGQSAWDRSRDRERHAERSRAQAAGEAVLAAANSPARRVSDEPPQGWLDDSEGAIRDLTEGPGR